jgi:chromosome segregation ATPase
MLAKPGHWSHLWLIMKNRLGIIILILACVVLCIALIWSQNTATEQQHKAEANITTYSNNLKQTSAELEEQRSVNANLNKDLDVRKTQLADLTNHLTDTSEKLSKTEETLKSTQDQLAQRDSKIADLESQNQALDQRAADLTLAITNLTSQIDDTQKKLAASEGDKAFLEKELQRLMTEKAELERQFNDLAVLRTQVAKLKEELNISRRLEWIRQGLFARADQKGAEQLIQRGAGAAATTTNQAKAQGNYDLNVEVNADGTVKVIPPMTNNTATPPPQ